MVLSKFWKKLKNKYTIMPSKYLLNFAELDCKNVELTGGKGASLAHLTQSGIPVPLGFVITTIAFEEFIKTSGLDISIESLLNNAKENYQNQEKLENISQEISDLILNQQLGINLQLQIKNQFKNLDSTWVAVRSSATSEDGAESAWAGQLDSFLNTDEQSLIENIKKCWASLFSPRALFYRYEKGFESSKISVAVVVQSMIQSQVSGIAFTVHPVTEDKNILLIEAGFGLGEAIVSGQITPDSFEIEKVNLQILNQQRNDQTRGIFLDEFGNNVWKNTTDDSSIKSNLAENQVLELVKICIQIEKYYGFPCDIEWAFYQNHFYILQSRPITTLT
jgi:pyruvate,water dikinase